MAEITKKKPLQIDGVDLRGDYIDYSPEPQAPKKTVLDLFKQGGAVNVGGNMFTKERGAEGIGKGLASGSANYLRGILTALTEQLPKTAVPFSGPSGYSVPSGIDLMQGKDPLSGFKDLLKGVEESNKYTEKFYKGENFTSLLGNLAKSGTVEDLQRFTDYTSNVVAQNIPQQAVNMAGALAGVPAPIVMGLAGLSAGGSKYSEDLEENPQLNEAQRLQRSAISGTSAAATEGIGFGLSKLAFGGKTLFDAIPEQMKPVLMKSMGKSMAQVMGKVQRAVGANAGQRLLFNSLVQSLGEGSEEVADTLVNIASDEHYAVRMYTVQEKLTAMIEAFGIGAIASGIVGSPLMAVTEIQNAQDQGTLPTPEELFATSFIIKSWKNGIPGSQNPENQIHVSDADIILLESKVDSMIQNKEWDDSENSEAVAEIGNVIREKAVEYSAKKDESDLGFFSAVEKTISEKMQNVATPEQVMGLLKNTPGVKQEEIDWLGIEEFLKGKQKVAKEELLDFVRQNNVQVKQVVKGGQSADSIYRELEEIEDIKRALARGLGALGPVYISGNPLRWMYADSEGGRHDVPEDRAKILDQLEERKAELESKFDENGEISDKGPKFGNYQLPGGNNYREVLLTLPTKLENSKVIEKEGKWYIQSPSGSLSSPFVSKKAAEKLMREVIQRRASGGRSYTEETFRSSHFDEPNILAHFRLNDRQTEKGKTLFIEEVQSDWHQAGRKSGYKGGQISKAAKAIVQGEQEPGRRNLYTVYDESGNKLDSNVIADTEQEAIEKINKMLGDPFDRQMFDVGKVPDAPFKKTWHELALKRILRMAVEEGYDSIAWTTGEQQAERYDLSKHLESIGYEKRGSLYNIAAFGKNGEKVWSNQSATAQDVEDHLGKEILKKIEGGEGEFTKSSPMSGLKYLTGLDLKVGGEPMKVFYDQILKNFLNKYTKKWGGRVGEDFIERPDKYHGHKRFSTRTESGEIAGQYESRENAERFARQREERGLGKTTVSEDFPPKSEKVHALEITPSMQLSLMSGQAIFEPSEQYAKKQTETENFKKWFGDSKVVDDNGKPLVVYHGTNQPINKFSRSRRGSTTNAGSAKEGFFFSDNPRVSEEYSKSAGRMLVADVAKFERKRNALRQKAERLERTAKSSQDWDAYEKAMQEWEDFELTSVREDENIGQNTIPVYLSMQNPLVRDFKGDSANIGQIHDVIKEAKKAGHDGVIMRNLIDPAPASDHYVVFNPNQIKSAIGNSGEFSQSSPNILREPDYKPKNLQKTFDFMYNSLGQEGEIAYGSKEKYKESLQELLGSLRGDTSGVQAGKILKQIFQNLKKNSFSPSVGLTVDGIKDAAELVSAYRNPSVEIFQVVFTDSNGKIIAHHAISSNIPNLGYVPKQFIQETIVDKAKKLNAHQIFLAHNHPSGNHKVSPEDIAITKFIAGAMKMEKLKTAFSGHIVMNGDKFSIIQADGFVSELTYKTKKEDFSPVRSAQLSEPSKAAMEIRNNFKFGKTTVVYMNNSNRVMAIEYYKYGANLEQEIPNKMRAYSSPKYIVSFGVKNVRSDRPSSFDALLKARLPEGLLDVILIEPSGAFISTALRGDIPAGRSGSAFGKVGKPEALRLQAFKIADIPSKFLNQAEEIKKSYTRSEITAAIGEIQKEIREIIANETDSLTDYGASVKGGEIVRPNLDDYFQRATGSGYRTSLPEELKHPKTGNKPVNPKQWRELAIRNLNKGISVSGLAQEYTELQKQKKVFIEKLVDVGMDIAQAQVSANEKLSKMKPEAIKEMSKEERAWFDLVATQPEIFDDVPPADYDSVAYDMGDIDPRDFNDITGRAMHLKDFYRNFETAFGQHFPKIEKKLLVPLDKAVNDSVNFQKSETEILKKEIIDGLGIKKKSKLSEAVQLWGEGKFNFEDGRYYKMTEQELVSMVGKENVDKVKQAEKWFRDKYNQLIEKINKSRIAIYPGKSEKLVPVRSNYFRHFRELTEFSSLKNMFDTPDNIPSELAGTSQFTQPKSRFASFMLRRFGVLTDIDAVGGFLDYIPSAAQAIYVDPMIPKIRAVEKWLRVLTHDSKNMNNFIEFLMQYANDLAGKTNIWDRGIQQLVGRKTMRVLNFVTRLAKKNAVLFSLSSMIVQASNLPQVAGKTKFYFPLGVGDFLKATLKKGGAHKQSLFLNTRYASGVLDVVNSGVLTKAESAGRWMMTLLDYVTTHMAWYSFYDMAIGNKIENPIRYADINTRKMVGGRGIHEVPLGQKAKAFQVLAPFTLEVQNLWWVLGDMKKEKDFLGIAIFAMVAWLMNNFYESIIGRRVIFDPVDALIEALKRDETGRTKTIPQAVGRLVGEVTSNMIGGNYIQNFYPEYGFEIGKYKMPTRSQFFGGNDRTRYGSGVMAIEAVKNLPLSLLPTGGGGQIRKTMSGAKAIKDEEVKIGNKKITVDPTPGTVAKALAFGKGAIPEVRDYYKYLNEKAQGSDKSEVQQKISEARKLFDEYRLGKRTGNLVGDKRKEFYKKHRKELEAFKHYNRYLAIQRSKFSYRKLNLDMKRIETDKNLTEKEKNPKLMPLKAKKRSITQKAEGIFLERLS